MKINKTKVEIKVLEKATVDVFKLSRDQLYGNENKFSAFFRGDLQSILETSKNSQIIPTEMDSNQYLNSSTGISLSFNLLRKPRWQKLTWPSQSRCQAKKL